MLLILIKVVNNDLFLTEEWKRNISFLGAAKTLIRNVSEQFLAKIDSPNMRPFEAHAGRRAWKTIDDRFLKSCYLSTEDNRKIRARKKKRKWVGKLSLVNRTNKSWNQIPAGLLASFPSKLNTFRKRVQNVVTSKGIEVGVECK